MKDKTWVIIKDYSESLDGKGGYIDGYIHTNGPSQETQAIVVLGNRILRIELNKLIVLRSYT